MFATAHYGEVISRTTPVSVLIYYSSQAHEEVPPVRRVHYGCGARNAAGACRIDLPNGGHCKRILRTAMSNGRELPHGAARF
jgi:hypothetical protein